MSESEFGPESENEDTNPGPEVTPELYREWRSPRAGCTNPEPMNNAVWNWLIRTKLNAYSANGKFEGPNPMDAGPAWCFDRFGQSSTLLPDGRTVLISGEHEDFYDPDFYIYNDVVVLHPDGKIDIFGYPREVFPPTDFHTATLVGNRIIITGNLGYPEQRTAGVTPVYVLNLDDFSISQVPAAGNQPGWIHKHTATLSNDAASILISGGKLDRANGVSLVENIDDWRLPLVNWQWERLTERPWTRWEIKRKDLGRNHLWEIRQLSWSKKARWKDDFERESAELREELGIEPNLDIIDNLYRPSVPHIPIPEVEGEFNVFRINVDGVVVRYVEEGRAIQLTVEGDLPTGMVEDLTSDLVEKLIVLENTLWEANPI